MCSSDLEATLDAGASVTATYTRQRLCDCDLAGAGIFSAIATVITGAALSSPATVRTGGMVGFPRNPPHKWWQKRLPKPKKEEEEEELAPASKAAEDDTVELMAVVMAMEDEY